MLGQGRPGQERAKEEKERLARLAIVSEGNFGVDPPTGSRRQWLMSYYAPVCGDGSALSWASERQRRCRDSRKIRN